MKIDYKIGINTKKAIRIVNKNDRRDSITSDYLSHTNNMFKYR